MSFLESTRHENNGPSATPAEAVLQRRIPSEGGRVHRPSVSLSETVLDSVSSDRARASIPEQYQSTFDELRNGILAFCAEFQIPVSALSNKEIFGTYLASPKIPQKRMEEMVLLFQWFEYLLVHKEPFKEGLPQVLEYTERLYHLREQYTDQVELLECVGILDEGAITGIDGNRYPLPTLEQIAQRVYEQREILETKHDQGFTKLLLIPFGMSLDVLISTFRKFLLDYKEDHENFDLNRKDPFTTSSANYQIVDRGGYPKIVYFPKSFDPKNHQGKNKFEILKDQAAGPSSFPGWTIHLFQPSDSAHPDSPGFASIPKMGKGNVRGKKNPRPDLEAGTSAAESLFFLQKVFQDPVSPYFHESGMTPEDWILMFMTHLQETGEPSDDCVDDLENRTYLIGSFFSSFFLVPCASWHRDRQQVSLNKYNPYEPNSIMGVRSSVII